MRHSKPHAHLRRYKSGKKRIINPTIPKKQRKVFTYLSDSKLHTNEYGGGLDFDKKGKLENINVMMGKEMDINLPSDYEVLYHTHPDKKVNPPSPDDIMALLSSNKQQAEIVFRNGKVFTVIKTPKSKELNKLPSTTLRNKLDHAFYNSHGPEWEKSYKKILEKYGFKVQINNNVNKDVNINIKPIEPRGK